MCGIAGIYNTSGEGINISRLKEMSSIIAYRGPDDFGYTLIKTQSGKHISFKESANSLAASDNFNLGFAHRRLSIIDFSEDGHQPMCNENSSIWLTYNGEIYNYIELSSELKNKGHVFRSKTDSEVIIHAYEEWGLECFSLFNGMWALALWDTNKRRLILSRDRFGVKPVYYISKEGTFSFASEIKSLVLTRRERPIPNRKAIYKFLKYGLIDTDDSTFFEGVCSIPSGNYLIITENGVESVKYWNITSNPKIAPFEINPSQVTDKFKELFIDSIRLRLRSDVPVGTCLSGGIDSSSIVYVLSSILGQKLSAFSSFYRDKGFEEEMYIDIVSKDCGLKSFKTNPDGRDFLEVMRKIVWHLDQPTSDSGVYSMWHVMKLAQPEVKVLLDGQGGDELLGGYFLFWYVYLHSRLMKSPFQSIWNTLEFSNINELNPLVPLFRVLFPYHAIQLGRNIKTRFDNIFTDDFKSYSDGFRKQYFSGENVFSDPTKNMMIQALTSFMLPHLLRNEDRISMAFSLESRLPFLDYRIVEFCFSCPSSLKFQDGRSKVLLRNAMGGIVNESILSRFDKKGFPTPAKKWFIHYYKDEVMDIIESREFKERGIFNTKKLRGLFSGFFRSKYDISSDISRIIMLDYWFRIFIEGKYDH
ncbi:asparagine synthase (glutamine-hydrolyzing) [Bacteroidota bacterium]